MRLKKNFRKENGMLLRDNDRDGTVTMYSNITVKDKQMIDVIARVSTRTGQRPAKILAKFVQRAWDAGILVDEEF